MSNDGKICCEICGARVHAIHLHLRDAHPDWTIEKYIAQHPEAPTLSEEARKKVDEHRNKAAKASTATGASSQVESAPFHEVFDLGDIKAARNSRGGAIMIDVLRSSENPEMIPEVSSGYVFEPDLLKNAMLAISLNMPLYVWGHAGTGKTTLLEQICARTRRPLLRVQHTINTEEAHLLGQWTVKGGETVFQLGPLAMAMKHGWAYLADEYDFALPSVIAAYQPILERNSAGEGKALVIKDAPPELRIIKPHPQFRFFATGNTNGSGDETGLYQGTMIQNAASYDRFGMVLKVDYMRAALEERVIISQAQGVSPEEAKRLVDFANRVREQFANGKISSTISPRTLINAANLGARRDNYRAGLALSFTNKLNTVDRQAVDGLAQRVFGGA